MVARLVSTLLAQIPREADTKIGLDMKRFGGETACEGQKRGNKSGREVPLGFNAGLNNLKETWKETG